MKVQIIPTQDLKMEFVTTERRKLKIIHEGFIYVFQKNLANEIRSYECELRRRGHCKAKIKINAGDEVTGSVNQHTHPPSAVNVEEKAKSSLKTNAENSRQPPQTIIENGLSTISATAAANFPSIEHMKRTIRGQRTEVNQQPNPINRAAIPDIPAEFQHALNEERFLMLDSGVGDENRMLIFATEQTLQLLSTSDDWYNDGIFSVWSQVFFQLYTTHVRV